MNRAKLIPNLEQIRALVDECLREVRHAGLGTQKVTSHDAATQYKAGTLSFELNALAFMNKYARGLKGPQKFTLLLARVVKGSTSQHVPRTQIENLWNKMRVLLGGRFYSAYANRAKANGWVDSPKHGVYLLSNSWKECLPKK